MDQQTIDRLSQHKDDLYAFKQLLIIKKDSKTIKRDRKVFMKTGFLSSETYKEKNLFDDFKKHGFKVNELTSETSYQFKRQILRNSSLSLNENGHFFFAKTTGDFISNYITAVFKKLFETKDFVLNLRKLDNHFVVEETLSNLTNNIGKSLNVYNFLDYYVVEISCLKNHKLNKTELINLYQKSLQNLIAKYPNIVAIDFDLKKSLSLSIIANKYDKIKKDEEKLKFFLQNHVSKIGLDLIIKMLKEKIDNTSIINVLSLSNSDDTHDVLDILKKYIEKNNIEFLNKVKTFI